MGTGGDATTDLPSAPEPSADVSVDAAPDFTSEPVIDTPGLDSGAEHTAPADISLTTQLEPASESEELTDEQKIAELKTAAEDPLAPAWYRNKLKETIGYSERLLANKVAAEEQAEQFRSQYEGKQTFDPVEIDRMRANEEQLLSLQSITATPETI